MTTKRFLDFFKVPKVQPESSLWVYVQCSHCGEVLRTRIDLQHDLSLIDGHENEQPLYICRKVLVGNQRCFQRIAVECQFDQNHHILERTIEGGKFITEQAYHMGTNIL